MNLVKILFVLCVVLLLAGTVVFIGGINRSSQPGTSTILTADGVHPVPNPWFGTVASSQDDSSVLTADGVHPVPNPWFGTVASSQDDSSVLTADGVHPVLVPWRGVAA